jgi:5-methylcytosine-specific restriction protein A
MSITTYGTLRRQLQGEGRQSSSARGYDHEWRQTRADYLRRNPLCVDCMGQGRTTPATDVHHVGKLRTHRHAKHEESNLMALCHECHARRTAAGE